LTDGRLESLADIRTGELIRLQNDRFTITIDGQALDSTGVTPTRVASSASSAAFVYSLPGARVTVTYELRAGTNLSNN
jgi:hypothetical protein